MVVVPANAPVEPPRASTAQPKSPNLAAPSVESPAEYLRREVTAIPMAPVKSAPAPVSVAPLAVDSSLPAAKNAAPVKPVKPVKVDAPVGIEKAESIEAESSPAMWSSPPADPPAPQSSRTKKSGMRRWVMAALAVLVVGQAGVIAALMHWNATAPVAEPVLPAPPPPPAPAADPLAMIPPATAAATPAATETASPTPAPVVPPVIAPASQIEVFSDPAGAKVTVNGIERGTTPIKIGVDPGSHVVVVSDGRGTTTRTLDVVAGASVTMTATLTPPAPVVGWVTVQSPLELQIISDATLLGTSKTAKIVLPPGHHLLELVHAPSGFQTTATVDIQAGRTARVPVTIPNSSIFINALPWATITLDGKDLGQTPIANQIITIGPHELIARHPVLGERKQTVMVTAKTPLRVVIDFGK